MRIIIHKSVKISRTVVQLSTLFFCSEIRVPVYVLYNFSASFFEWECQRGGQDILGGKCMWLPITHFHNTGHIFHVDTSPLSLGLSFLFASYGSFPFNLSFIPISRPFPPLIQLGE